MQVTQMSDSTTDCLLATQGVVVLSAMDPAGWGVWGRVPEGKSFLKKVCRIQKVSCFVEIVAYSLLSGCDSFLFLHPEILQKVVRCITMSPASHQKANKRNIQ